MAQPKHMTPPPFDRYHRDDDTPNWMTPVRHDTPGFGARAKKTMLAQPGQQYHLDSEQEHRPITEQAFFFTRETCWDCQGTGRSGAILYRCPVCGCGWTWAQIEAKAGDRGPRDAWGAVRLPCVRECGKIPTNRLYKYYEPCRTCYDPNDQEQVVKCRGKGYLDQTRPINEVIQYFAERIARALGISRAINLAEAATMPVPMFQQSEPTAPPPHLEHPGEHPAVRVPDNFTPTLKPLTPDEF